MISAWQRRRRLTKPAGGREETIRRFVTQWIVGHVDNAPHRVAAGAAAAGGIVTAVVVGPVAAILAAGYSAAAPMLWHRWRVRRAAKTVRAVAAQRVSLLAADMRAGVAACHDIGTVAAELPGDNDPVCQSLRWRLTAVAALSERLGMPAATLLDHFAQDLNTRTRLAGLLAGQTAGAMASARLLACLPLMGLLLGEAMGAAPIAFLLHTPLGAVCALGAAGLQAIGTRWAQYLATVEIEVVS